MTLDLKGVKCPECGVQSQKYKNGDEVMYRCLTDSCPRRWFKDE